MKLPTPFLGLAFVLALVPASPAASAPKSLARGVVASPYENWADAIHLESKSSNTRAVVVPGFGGRVVFYGARGENVLWTPPDLPNPAPAGPTDAPLAGGFQCVLGPETAAAPAQAILANGRYDWSVKGRSSLLVLKSPDEKLARASIDREVMLDPNTGDLGFLHRLKNLTDQSAAFTLWQRIACRPGGFVIVPLNKKSRFASGWSVRRDEGGKPTWDSAAPSAEGVKILDGVLVAKTGTGGGRVGADSDGQWMAYILGRTVFLVNFPYYASAIYAEGGNSVTFTWNDKMTELQPIGPEARLAYHKTADLPMKWSIIDLANEVTSFEQARAVADKIPASPFQ